MIINNPGDFGKGFLFFAFFAFSFIYVDGSIAFATTSVIVERGRGVFFSCPFCFIGHGVDVDANILPLSFLLTCFCFPPPCPFPPQSTTNMPDILTDRRDFPASSIHPQCTSYRGGIFFGRTWRTALAGYAGLEGQRNISVHRRPFLSLYCLSHFHQKSRLVLK